MPIAENKGSIVQKNLGRIRQLGIVVIDIEQAMRHWSAALGVGPFYYLAHAPAKDLRFNGAVCDTKLSLAFAQQGDLQIELVCPLDDVDSPFKAYQLAHGEGLQHVGYWPIDYEASYRSAVRAGWRCVFTGVSAFDSEARFAYFDVGGAKGSPLVEISSASASKDRFYRTVADASMGWSGDDPIRVPTLR